MRYLRTEAERNQCKDHPSEAVENAADARRAAAELGYPVIVRAAYALGGLGSGFCDNEDELNVLVEKGFLFLPASAGGEIFARLERGGVRSGTRPFRQLHHGMQHGELRPAGHPHRRVYRVASQTLSNTDYFQELGVRCSSDTGIRFN